MITALKSDLTSVRLEVEDLRAEISRIKDQEILCKLSEYLKWYHKLLLRIDSNGVDQFHSNLEQEKRTVKPYFGIRSNISQV